MRKEISRRQFSTAAVLGTLGIGGISACSNDKAQPQPAQAKRAAPPLHSSNSANSNAGSPASEAQGPALKAMHEAISKKMYGFTTGNEKSETAFYIVVDVMCPHCAHTWMHSQKLWQQYKFVWLPVPMMGEDSMKYGSIIMGSSNPAEAMNVHEHKMLAKLEPMPYNEQAFSAGQPQLEHNYAFAKSIRLDSVPLIVLKRPSGEVVSTSGGMSSQDLIAIAS